ncbi:hypothetical protein [Nitrospirillum pindoramense]|uniref:HAF family extracellular repeat protein n=1 Tax=Nitrospirillum amazonense TaxID=28077 RepID=A0A560HFP9_9PROT|nr:hypothetical protein [Nitrospirillum amazonense]TWB45252.1 hypothetical protein FBZ90_102207 [Nitrospirillum amazonense]
MSTPTVTYTDIFAPNYSVTGIRQDGGDGHPVIITGSYQQNGGAPQGLLYRGPLSPTDSDGYIFLTPTFPGQTVTSSIFYGPNTPLFDPTLGKGNIRAVGSYKYSEGGKADHGMIYQGAPDGSGTWTQIDVPADVAGGTVANTIPHSTMGDLVVGNYDVAGKPASGNGFIHNLKTGAFQILDIGPLATLYGIWQNAADGPAAYTVAGGYKNGKGLNVGLLADYDPATGALSNITELSYKNLPGIITHFEGITGVPGGYALAATTDAGAAFAHVARETGGGFGEARWLASTNPATTGLCTANSILGNTLIGIYQPASGGIQSYAATLGE